MKRDNVYYLERLRKLRPDIYADFKSGKISSVAEALDVSGIKPRRTALQQLQSAWSKADPRERDTFRQMIGCVPASAGRMTGSASASSGSPIHVDRRLTPAATAQITAIMTRRNLRMGQVMTELGFSPLNVSLGNALARGTKLRPEVLDRLEEWLSKFAAGAVQIIYEPGKSSAIFATIGRLIGRIRGIHILRDERATMPPPNQTDRGTLTDQDTCGPSAPPSDRAAEGSGGDAELANAFEVDPLCPANLTSDASLDDVPTDSDPVVCVDIGRDNFASDWRDPRTHSGQCLQGRNASAFRASPVANLDTPLSPPLKPSPAHALTMEVQASPAPGEATRNVVSFPSPRGSRKTGRPRKRKVSVVGTSTRVGRIKGRPKRIANRPGQPRRWRDLTEREKFRLSIEHCKASRGIAVTLNLSLGRAASLVSETNVTSPVRLFQNSLNRALKDAGLAEIPYGLKFELSPIGKLHLHGVFEHGDMGQEGLARLKRAFRNAAGFIKGKAGASQVKFQEITDAAGWDRYLAKAIRKTSKHMGVKRLLLISRSMKRKTRHFYEESRRGRWTG